MEAENKIKAYIAPKKAMYIVGLISVIIGVGSFLLLAWGVLGPQGEATKFSTSGNGESKWCWFDATAVSDWVYKHGDETYYIAMNDENDFCIVRLKDSAVKKLGEQQTYWFDDDAPAPPARLQGMPKPIGGIMRSYVSDAVDIQDPFTFNQYFGTVYLDATTGPKEENAYVWVFPGIIGLVFTLIFLWPSVVGRKASARSLAALGTYEVQQAAAELDSPLTVQENKDALRLGENFLFARRKGLVVPYRRILWVYQQLQRMNGVPTSRHLMVGDETGRVTSVIAFGSKAEAEVLRLMGYIAEKNPGVRVGFDKDSRQWWQEYVKSKKSR